MMPNMTRNVSWNVQLHLGTFVFLFTCWNLYCILNLSICLASGSLWVVHPQHGGGSHRWTSAGRWDGAAGLPPPRLDHLQRLVFTRGRLHHPGAVRYGRGRRLFRWGSCAPDQIHQRLVSKTKCQKVLSKQSRCEGTFIIVASQKLT